MSLPCLWHSILFAMRSHGLVSHFFLYSRLAVGGSEDDVNQAADMAMRHKPQSSLTGLLFLLERFPPLGFVA